MLDNSKEDYEVLSLNPETTVLSRGVEEDDAEMIGTIIQLLLDDAPTGMVARNIEKFRERKGKWKLNYPMVIAVSGAYGSGKDTLCYAVKRFAESKGLKVQTLAFGDAVKRSLNEGPLKNFGVNLYDPEIKAKARSLFQSYAEFVRQVVSPTYWASHTLIEMNKNADIVLISDLRHQNELSVLKAQCETITVRVVGNSNEDPHISERDLDDHFFDYFIFNDKSKEDFEQASVKLFLTILEETNSDLLKYID